MLIICNIFTFKEKNLRCHYSENLIVILHDFFKCIIVNIWILKTHD